MYKYHVLQYIRLYKRRSIVCALSSIIGKIRTVLIVVLVVPMNRVQYIHIVKYYFELLRITNGIPESSVLGPVLFLAYKKVFFYCCTRHWICVICRRCSFCGNAILKTVLMNTSMVTNDWYIHARYKTNLGF